MPEIATTSHRLRSRWLWSAPLLLLCGACSSSEDMSSGEPFGESQHTLEPERRAVELADGSNTSAPSRTGEREPTAGAPYDIHFGPYGLCIDHGQWDRIPEAGGIYFDPGLRLLTISPGSAWRSELRLSVETQGTSNWYDDTVEIELSMAYEGVPGPPTVVTESLPYYAPPVGPIDDYATSTEPKELNVLKLEYRSSTDEDRLASVINGTRIPTRAQGHFDRPWTGAAQGFFGGSAPDCVSGSNFRDIISGRGGADHLRGKYGDDFLFGGDGNDTLEGGNDNDVMDGGRGVDKLVDGRHEDCFIGGAGGDGLRDLFIADINFANDYPRYVMEPGVVNGVAVDNIEHLYGDVGFFAGVDVCP